MIIPAFVFTGRFFRRFSSPPDCRFPAPPPRPGTASPRHRRARCRPRRILFARAPRPVFDAPPYEDAPDEDTPDEQPVGHAKVPQTRYVCITPSVCSECTVVTVFVALTVFNRTLRPRADSKRIFTRYRLDVYESNARAICVRERDMWLAVRVHAYLLRTDETGPSDVLSLVVSSVCK